jgi:hypothetical protein
LPERANINKLAVLYGLLTGVFYIVVTTIINRALIANFFVFYAAKFGAFLLYLVVVGLFAALIKKQLGGYIDFKTAFKAIFIMVLLAELFYFVYLYAYVLYIDPEFLAKVKTSTMDYMKSRNAPADIIADKGAKFDIQAAEAKHFHLGKNLVNYFSFVILDSLFGLIIAAVLKNKRSQAQAF